MKTDGSAEAQAPHKLLTINGWTENQELYHYSKMQVWLKQSTCCPNNFNIPYESKKVRRMVTETENPQNIKNLRGI